MQIPTTLDYVLRHLAALPRGSWIHGRGNSDGFARPSLRRVLTLKRSIAALAGLSLAYIGFQEAQLRVCCGAQVEMQVKDLAQVTTDDPLWVKLQGLAPPVNVGINSSETGNHKAVWFPLVSPDDPRTAAAVVCVEGMEDAWALQASKTPVTLQGLAYFPRRAEAGNIASYLSRLHLREGRGLRVVEMGRAPSNLAGAMVLMAAGAAIVFVALRRVPMLRAPREPSIHTLAGYASEPLPEDVKVEVRHMVDEVWAETR